MTHLLEFISFDPKSIKAMSLENFKKDPSGLWLIIQNTFPFPGSRIALINIILIEKISSVPPPSSLISIFSASFSKIKKFLPKKPRTCSLDHLPISNVKMQAPLDTQLDQRCIPFQIPLMSLLHQPRWLHRFLPMAPMKILMLSQLLLMNSHFKMRLKTLLALPTITPQLQQSCCCVSRCPWSTIIQGSSMIFQFFAMIL